MPKVIVFRQKGDWKKSRKFLKRCSNLNLDELLDRYGQEGVEALAKATPKDTGKTAASWSYTVAKGKESITITWRNSNIVDGVPIAVILQYGQRHTNGRSTQRAWIISTLRCGRFLSESQHGHGAR